MKNRWNDEEAAALASDVVSLRAYTSRLLGQEPDLALHGGGNTSVKVRRKDFFGREIEVLYVKGSGNELATIGPRGFAPVRLDVLRRMADLEALTDTDMVRQQRAALLDPEAPTPSVEAILHALIPFAFVDHSHADAVCAISDSPRGDELLREIYGARVIHVPYVMPGFVLARTVRSLTRSLDWLDFDAMTLSKHGMFTWGHDARSSYDRMIEMVSRAEEFLRERGVLGAPVSSGEPGAFRPLGLARLRAAVSAAAGRPMVARLDRGELAVGFANREDAGSLATRGPLTPDHVLRAGRSALIVGDDPESDVREFAESYRRYFARQRRTDLTRLPAAPGWAVWPGCGTVAFGPDPALAAQTLDIVRHTVRGVQWSEALGGFTPPSERQIFEVEYWELEQAKLRRAGAPDTLQGRIALVSGGAGGIGGATARLLRERGAAVCVLDLRDEVEDLFRGDDAVGIRCDVTRSDEVAGAVLRCVEQFGGLDILVSNAGDFPPSRDLVQIDEVDWQRCLDLNLTSHVRLLREATPYLMLGLNPAVVVIGSRNVLAPGPGAAAYSAAKAALTQVARVASLELGPMGVRVNVLHPDKVFDTRLWTEEKLSERASRYGIDVPTYKRRNLLGVEVTAADVARLACALAGPLFAATTGAQIPIDGGSERVI